MDDFVAMLERATEPVQPDVMNRVVEAIASELAAQAPRHVADLADTDATVTLRPDRPWDRRRWNVAAAAFLVVAAMVIALIVWQRPDSAPAVTAHDPGRLPARVELGETGWTLTWLPPDYEPTSATRNALHLTSADQPEIVITAQRGESPILGPALYLGPLAEAHHDEAAGVLQWNQGGWTFTIDASTGAPRAVLLRLAVAIVPDSRLEPPPASKTSLAQVPDVVGLDYRDATERLVDAGLTVRWGISSTNSTSIGMVERTTPVAGSPARPGESVTLGVFGLASRLPPSGDLLVSGDLHDAAVGYYPTWLSEPVWRNASEVDSTEPIVFLHGELVGYGVGDHFDPLLQAATNAPRPAFTSTETTVGTAPIESAAPSERATLIELAATSPVLAPTKTLVDLTGYENGALVMSPDGRIIAGKVDGEMQHLFELRSDGSSLDLGIELQVGAALAFGPRGDLFAVEYSLHGTATAKVSEYRPTPSSAWTWIATAEAGVSGECGISVAPSGAGCPGTGPLLGVDPPTEFDRVEIDPSLTTVTATAGKLQRHWSITLRLLFDLSCDDDTCTHMAAPGPNNSAVWYPRLLGQQASQAVFVLDDRPVAGAAWLDPRITDVLGVHGTDLVAVQSAQGTLQVVAVDLQPILG